MIAHVFDKDGRPVGTIDRLEWISGGDMLLKDVNGETTLVRTGRPELQFTVRALTAEHMANAQDIEL